MTESLTVIFYLVSLLLLFTQTTTKRFFVVFFVLYAKRHKDTETVRAIDAAVHLILLHLYGGGPDIPPGQVHPSNMTPM